MIDSTSLPQKHALFIDVDDTLIRPVGPGPELLLGQSLLRLMRDQAVEDGAWRADEAEREIDRIYRTNRWWHWSDFLCALDLDAHRFWIRALEEEADHFAAVSPDLPDAFDRLLEAGFRMFITSNNPSSGILLKLTLAGLARMDGSRYFRQYLNPPALHHMKEEPGFWRQALAHTGLHPDRITVIGDSWSDDVLAPRAAGIRSCIRIGIPPLTGAGSNGEAPDQPPAPPPGVEDVPEVSSWADILALLVPPHSAA